MDTDITTVSQAPSSPTPPGPLTTPAAPAQSRAGSIADAQWDGLPPAEQDRYARVRKGPDGGSEWVLRDQLSKEPADPANPGSTPAPGDGKATVTEDGKLRLGDLVLDAADVQKLMTESAARVSRKATMPSDAASYALDLPADFQMPQGMQWQWATDHPVQGPLLAAAKEFAFAHGLDQPGFSKMLGLFAAYQVQEAQAIDRAKAAELAKLGATATTRVDSITQFVRGLTGDDKLAAGVTKMLFTADQVRAWEKIIARVTNQGAASFRQDGREPIGPSKGPLSGLSETEYNALSANETFRISRMGS